MDASCRETSRRTTDGDGTYVDAPDLNDDRTHNVVNELTARDTDDNGSNNYTLTYDAAGNLTDDGEAYEYVYDGFGRLRRVLRTDNQNLVAEYWYNGLNHRITMHNDTDSDSDVDANDKKFHLAYTERWQIAATFRESDSSAKESFVYHTAGLSGGGGSSKLDDVLVRDKDANTAWTTASDGTLEERRYFLHNWRGDLVAIVTDTGTLVEQTRHSSYGVPFGMHQGDVDADGDIDATDASIIQGWIDTSTLTVRGDLDLDRDVDAADKSICEANAGKNLGRGKLSYSGVRNRAGYGGYQLDAAIDALYHVRHRVLNTTLGRWTRRDPMEYADGGNLYGYAISNPMKNLDIAALCVSCGPSGFQDGPNTIPTDDGPSYQGPGTCGPCISTPCPHGTIPRCPLYEPATPNPTDPDDPIQLTNDHWCRDSLFPHCRKEGVRCYRSFDDGAKGGQQCCYRPRHNGDPGDLIDYPPNDPCMGTIDICGPANSENRRGNCNWHSGLQHVFCHFLRDYLDCRFHDCTQINCCLRAVFGVASGTACGNCVTDRELRDHHEQCENLVDQNPQHDYCADVPLCQG